MGRKTRFPRARPARGFDNPRRRIRGGSVSVRGSGSCGGHPFSHGANGSRSIRPRAHPWFALQGIGSAWPQAQAQPRDDPEIARRVGYPLRGTDPARDASSNSAAIGPSTRALLERESSPLDSYTIERRPRQNHCCANEQRCRRGTIVSAEGHCRRMVNSSTTSPFMFLKYPRAR